MDARIWIVVVSSAEQDHERPLKEQVLATAMLHWSRGLATGHIFAWARLVITISERMLLFNALGTNIAIVFAMLCNVIKSLALVTANTSTKSLRAPLLYPTRSFILIRIFFNLRDTSTSQLRMSVIYFPVSKHARKSESRSRSPCCVNTCLF